MMVLTTNIVDAMFRRVDIFRVFGSVLIASGVALAFSTAVLSGSPQDIVPKHERMAGIDDSVYENLALESPGLTRRFEYVLITNSQTISDGEASSEETEHFYKILSHDGWVIRRQMGWSNETSSGTATNHLVLNGLLEILNKVDSGERPPDVKEVLSASGRLWPLAVGGKFKMTVALTPNWTDEEYLIESDYEIVEKFPARTLHSQLTGGAFKIKARNKWFYKSSGDLASSSVMNYAVVPDLGYAFPLDFVYESADSSYTASGDYNIEGLNFLD